MDSKGFSTRRCNENDLKKGPMRPFVVWCDLFKDISDYLNVRTKELKIMDS